MEVDAFTEVSDHEVAQVALLSVAWLQGLVRVGKVSHERLLDDQVGVSAEQGPVAVANGRFDAFFDEARHDGTDESVA